MSHTISLYRWPCFPRALNYFLQPWVSRVLLKILAVPNKQSFWSKVMIPGVPILLIHILMCLLTVPRAPITMGIRVTLCSSRSFARPLLRRLVRVFDCFSVGKMMKNYKKVNPIMWTKYIHLSVLLSCWAIL